MESGNSSDPPDNSQNQNDSVAPRHDLAVIFRNLSFKITLKEPVEVTPTEQQESQPKKTLMDKIFKKKCKTEWKERQILSDITGIFRPGRLTAVMGASGAGKTTLLSVIAGNVEGGRTEGRIEINGEDFSQPGRMQDISGFVFQDDVLLPTMKVKEAV